MDTVLVTGGSGWLGRYVVTRLLASGAQVHATYRSSAIPELPCSWHRVDLLCKEEIVELVHQVRPTRLIHLAWESVPPACYHSPANYDWVQSSKELVRQFHACGGRRIVVAGTGAEYEWVEGYLNEADSACSYRTPYAACKNNFRTWLEGYAEAAGLRVGWGRIFHLYGPCDPGNRLITTIIVSLLKQVDALCTHGNQSRDFLYIADAADALVQILHSGVQGTVNVASGRPVQLKQIGSWIGEQLGGTGQIRYGTIPFPQGEPLFIGADVQRLSKEVNWQPHYSMEAGLHETIAWWRSRLKSEDGKAAE